jgi:hypothetical protein
VIIAEKGATGGVDVRGSAPGTRETDLLDQSTPWIRFTPSCCRERVWPRRVWRHAALEERKIGFPIGGGVVPMCPRRSSSISASVISAFGPIENAATRREGRIDGSVAEGNVGAGAARRLASWADRSAR